MVSTSPWNHRFNLWLVWLFSVMILPNQVNGFQQSFVKQQLLGARAKSDPNRQSLQPLQPLGRNPMHHIGTTAKNSTPTTTAHLFAQRWRDPPTIKSPSTRLLKMKMFLHKMLRVFRPRHLKQLLLVGTLLFASFFASPALAGTSGGRIGGTYSRPSRPSMSRSSTARPSRAHSRPLPRKHYYYPKTRPRYRTSSPVYHPPIGYSTTTIVESPYRREIHPRKIQAGDLLLWTGVGLAVSTGVRKHYEEQHNSRKNTDHSPLGPGATSAFVTVALQVPDRSSPSSILKILESKAMTGNTETRRGLQQIVSEVALELLRKDSSAISVGTSIQHFDSVRDAQVAFQKASILNRSKLDRESGETGQRLLLLGPVSFHWCKCMEYSFVVSFTTLSQSATSVVPKASNGKGRATTRTTFSNPWQPWQ